MIISDFLAPAPHGLAVQIIILGEAEIAEPVFGGTREDALESEYANREVDAWEIAVYWITGTKTINIFITMNKEEFLEWYGGKSP